MSFVGVMVVERSEGRVMVVERYEGKGGGCDTRGGCVCATIGGS